KYSKEWLLKYQYCAHIINAKKVICICGKAIKLNRHYEEDYLNHYVKSSGCKVKE
ncbi:15034_t:CDS:1, partial [Racocetra persica]